MRKNTHEKNSATFEQVFERLCQYGVLLLSDKTLPSVATLVAGSPVKGSWWAHARAHDIFRVTRQIANHRDIIVAKLICAKITFVYRKLWSPLFAVAGAKDLWQIRGLTQTAVTILDAVSREGRLRTDQHAWSSGISRKGLAKAVKELENKLLIYSEEVHTERRSHAKLLETWEEFAKRKNFQIKKMNVSVAQKSFEVIVQGLNREFKARGLLPWQIE